MKQNIIPISTLCLLLSTAILVSSNHATGERQSSSWPIKVVSPWKFVVTTILLFQSAHAIDPETPFACAKLHTYLYSVPHEKVSKSPYDYTICRHLTKLRLNKPGVSYWDADYDLLPRSVQELCTPILNRHKKVKGQWVDMNRNDYYVEEYTLQCTTSGFNEEPEEILKKLYG